MTLELDISGDAGVFDGTTSVVLQQPGEAELALSGVSPLKLAETEFALLGGSLAAGDTTRAFSLPVAVLAGRTPRVGDTLADGEGNVWRVQHASLLTCGTRWRVLCRRDR